MRHRSRVRGDRLSPLDMSNLGVEARGLPMHVAAVAVLDGTPLLDVSGQLRLEAIRRHVEERSRQAHRLRQVLRWPRAQAVAFLSGLKTQPSTSPVTCAHSGCRTQVTRPVCCHSAAS
jgi:hypothetical protein